MRVWGKIILGAVGLLWGGPVGGIVGVSLGALVDYRYPHRKHDSLASQEDDHAQIIFKTALIALSAKMTRADGRTSHEEFTAFRQLFKIRPDQVDAMRILFEQACSDGTDPLHYAHQLRNLHHRSPQVLEEVLTCLMFIAASDGHISAPERIYLWRIAEVFGFSRGDFDRLCGMHSGTKTTSCYEVLGVSSHDDLATIRRAYHSLVARYHPDKLIASGVPTEMIEGATKKMAAINAAWDEVQKQRQS
ncbi:MAG: TerB family tellurite resistance protein [Pseudomonadota bacterium]